MGTLIFGGPGRIGPVPGQVMAVSSASEQFTVTAGDDGRFRLYLPLGRYQLTGHSPARGQVDEVVFGTGRA